MQQHWSLMKGRHRSRFHGDRKCRMEMLVDRSSGRSHKCYESISLTSFFSDGPLDLPFGDKPSRIWNTPRRAWEWRAHVIYFRIFRQFA